MKCKPRYLVLFHTPADDVEDFADQFGEDPPFDILIPGNGHDLIIDTDA